jgi:type VI secretion system protein ImpI
MVEYGLEVTLVDTSDGTREQRAFRKPSIRIGRNALNDLQIDKPFVSQFHVVIELDAGRFFLQDLGSTNGTLVAGQRIKGHSVELGDAAEIRFGILALTFEVKRVNLEALGPPASDHRPMAVTGFLTAPSEQEFAAAALAAAQQSDPHEAQDIAELYATYRLAWSKLQAGIQSAALKRPSGTRGAFITALSSKHPALSAEPDFHRLADWADCSRISVRDTAAEHRIAAEGLRELAFEYVPNAPPPETSGELVQFLTRIRETLHVLFKSFVPLRDGYHQLLKELRIPVSRKTVSSPVDTAASPTELSSVVLNPQMSADHLVEMESMFADLMIHQVAMVNGVMTGVRELLEQLSPEQIRQAVEGRGRSGFQIGGPGARQYWEEYERRHGDFASEEKQIFATLFGRRFSAAYGEIRAESAERVRPTHPPGGSTKPT